MLPPVRRFAATHRDYLAAQAGSQAQVFSQQLLLLQQREKRGLRQWLWQHFGAAQHLGSAQHFGSQHLLQRSRRQRCLQQSSLQHFGAAQHLGSAQHFGSQHFGSQQREKSGLRQWLLQQSFFAQQVGSAFAQQVGSQHDLAQQPRLNRLASALALTANNATKASTAVNKRDFMGYCSNRGGTDYGEYV